MKKMRVLLVGAVVATAAFTAGLGQASSNRCSGGQDAASGVSVRNQGDPAAGDTAGWLAVCNDGSTVPVGGSVEVGGDAGAQEGYVHADGDGSNGDMHTCADGFVRAEGSAGGPVFYSGPDGDWKDTNGSASGSPDADPKGPDAVIQDTAADCQ